MRLTLKIDNVYDDGTITNTLYDVEVPDPPSPVYKSDEHDDWADSELLPLTGTGREEGDAGYFVEIIAAEHPALVGRTYEWGV
jgi:hypothetical protein